MIEEKIFLEWRAFTTAHVELDQDEWVAKAHPEAVCWSAARVDENAEISDLIYDQQLARRKQLDAVANLAARQRATKPRTPRKPRVPRKTLDAVPVKDRITIRPSSIS